ncbi:MAG: NF038104 family lipoprotein [Mariprofundus sp.]|nr:NF038104 family lipoprotein [Mariprofundus sp.]
MKKSIMLFILMFGLNGCLIGTAVGTAVDVGIEVVKVPFKVGGAIYDGVTGDDEDSDSKASEEKD